MISGKRVLVTGCSGLLGTALCEKLLSHNAQIYGLDREHHPKSRIHEIKSRLNLITADVRDFERLNALIEKERIEFVFHLAAQAIVGEAAKQPVETFKDNIEGTWNVLESARLAGARQNMLAVIVASSDKAYGDQDQLPYVETAPMQGRFPYDVSKSCADLIAQSYFHSYKVPVCVVRCGNLYGAGDLQFSRIVPGTILSLLNNERPVIRSDGTNIRDYVYVEDAADAYIAIAGAMMKDAQICGEAFNIGDNTPLSVLDVVKEIQKVMRREDLEPIIANVASLEIKKQFLDSNKVRRLVGWQPSHTFAQALAKTVAWYSTVYFQQKDTSSV
ncbi:MAG TPA: NAD-dependent epimerase/dehydratase family protein [Planktothrix sp.]|jgi:CDP-glucose 4,6-dehydratase